jgi:hypothetical protein
MSLIPGEIARRDQQQQLVPTSGACSNPNNQSLAIPSTPSLRSQQSANICTISQAGQTLMATLQQATFSGSNDSNRRYQVSTVLPPPASSAAAAAAGGPVVGSLFDFPLTNNGSNTDTIKYIRSSAGLTLPLSLNSQQMTTVPPTAIALKMSESIFSHSINALTVDIDRDNGRQRASYNQEGFYDGMHKIIKRHPKFNLPRSPPSIRWNPQTPVCDSTVSSAVLKECVLDAPGVINIVFVAERHDSDVDINRANSVLSAASGLSTENAGKPFFTMAIVERGLTYNVSDVADVVMREDDLTRLRDYTNVDRSFLEQVQYSDLDNGSSINFGLVMSKVDRSNALGMSLAYWLGSRDRLSNERIVVFIGESHVSDFMDPEKSFIPFVKQLSSLRDRVFYVTVLPSLSK